MQTQSRRRAEAPVSEGGIDPPGRDAPAKQAPGVWFQRVREVARQIEDSAAATAAVTDWELYDLGSTYLAEEARCVRHWDGWAKRNAKRDGEA